jgi:beta-glucosidase
MSDAPLPSFPPGFLWGVSSSAFQVEGALDADGRGRSVWDTFAAEPGRIENGDDPSVSSDHYHRHAEDVALMNDLGVGAYRFSIAWPRVIPDGSGPVNAKGLDFYDGLVDELRTAGIRPVPTLFHWDTPQPIEDAGGWLNRDTAYRFAEYAAVVADRLADRVDTWITINEPAEHTLAGYGLGHHAPGKALLFDALPAAHHQLLAHGLAVRALREHGGTNIGIANSHGPTLPAGDGEADVFAAEFYDTLMNWLFADPILTGRYPDEGLAALMPGPVAEDLEIISTPLDWYGLNYYQVTKVGDPASAAAASSFAGMDLPPDLPFGIQEIDGYPRTDFGWPVMPEGLYEMLTGLRDRYGDRLPPLYITENGCSYGEGPDAGGRVADDRRIAYLDGHLRAMHRAIDAGVDVRGYFVWSFTDNFEWAAGYGQRFGLVHIDYETLKRTPKDSFFWYRDAIAGGHAP